MRWAEIIATVAEESAELAANILIEEGCGGASISGPSVRASGPAELSADLPVPEETTVTSYLPVDDRLEARLGAIRDRIRELPGEDSSDITIKWVEDSDWAGAWKSFFKPVLIGNVFIKPSWEDVSTEAGQVVVEIDPGMAFGTGNHPTTQLCLQFLQDHIRGGERMLDVGTGSAILSIAAAKLGAREVVATEIDPIAVEAAKKNVERNGVSDRVKVFEAEALDSAGDGFDLVVANITANTIIALASELGRAPRVGGTLVASGIIEARADEVVERLTEEGFELAGKNTDDDWVVLEMSKKR